MLIYGRLMIMTMRKAVLYVYKSLTLANPRLRKHLLETKKKLTAVGLKVKNLVSCASRFILKEQFYTTAVISLIRLALFSIIKRPVSFDHHLGTDSTIRTL